MPHKQGLIAYFCMGSACAAALSGGLGFWRHILKAA
jgi:hypothetical protein